MSEKKVSFKDTLNLPKTDLPIHQKHQEFDAAMIERWEKEDLFHASWTHNEGADKYIVHDGPPYCNGPIHIGHAYNKILKDIVAKSRRMAGMHVPVTPGWDCHGLPIEINVAKQHPLAQRAELIAYCREYAHHWIAIQRTQFKQLGVLMDWNHPYLTMNHAYESAILRAFGSFVKQGYIERKFKTVPWCASCQTSLASAEIEYKDRQDPSIFVLFPLEAQSATKLLPQYQNDQISLLVWTTTPWTLPLNRAVAVRPNTPYTLLSIDGELVFIAQARVGVVSKLFESKKIEILEEFMSEKLIGLFVEQPITGKNVPIIAGDDVSLADGTACVHTAPGCGPEDYEQALKHGLEIYSPLAPDGTYDGGIVPADLQGVSILDAQKIVVDRLREQGRLMYEGIITHSYPHCWRCRKGLMFRATKQWFLNLGHRSLQDDAIEQIDKMTFLPPRAANHVKAAVESRLEWCISRQRIWGVPIPALVCADCDAEYLTQELVQTVAEGVAQEGIEFWGRVDIAKLSHNGKCSNCGSSNLRKEFDILDVWFDSGVSHYAVLNNNPGLAFPADIYIEGRDQARGWFQSSLLTSVALEGRSCMRSILLHGFVADETGAKMSKSLGNVVAPIDVITKYGTDILRLWVASGDYVDDAVISETILNNLSEVHRKIRNTARFLLSNLYDFSIEKDAIPFEKLLLIDQYALRQLYLVSAQIREDYERINCTGAVHTLSDYCTTQLSALYLEIIKDRLYVERADGLERRSAQTVCWYILDTITKLMAPVMSFAAEQISDHYQTGKTRSIHLEDFARVPDICRITSDVIHHATPSAYDGTQQARLHLGHEFSEQYCMQYDVIWAELINLRQIVLKEIELLREQGIVKLSLEARVTLAFVGERAAWINSFFGSGASARAALIKFLKEFLIVSQVEVLDAPVGLKQASLEGLFVLVERAQGNKCPRCWQYDTTQHEHHLCDRCERIVNKR